MYRELRSTIPFPDWPLHLSSRFSDPTHVVNKWHNKLLCNIVWQYLVFRILCFAMYLQHNLKAKIYKNLITWSTFKRHRWLFCRELNTRRIWSPGWMPLWHHPGSTMIMLSWCPYQNKLMHWFLYQDRLRWWAVYTKVSCNTKISRIYWEALFTIQW